MNRRALNRRASSLIEVLTVCMILSGSLLVVFGLLHGTARESAFNKHNVIAWQLLANMYERYHLVPPARLERMFSKGDGEALIQSDTILNHPSALSLAELKKLGFRRSAFFKKVSGGLKSHGVLHLVVSWKGLDGKEHTISHQVLPADPHTGPLAWLASLKSNKTAQELEEERAAEADRQSDAGLHPLIALLRRKDARDGRVDGDWPTLSVNERLPVVLNEVIKVLERQKIPDGIYPFEWETVTFEGEAVRVREAARSRLVVLELTGIDGHVWLMLREEYTAPGKEARTLRLLDGAPMASQGDRFVSVPPREKSLSSPFKSRAHVDVTPTRLLVYRQRADGSGHEMPTAQTLELIRMPPETAEMLRKDNRTRDSYLATLAAEVDRLAVVAGLDRAELPPDPASQLRLGW